MQKQHWRKFNLETKQVMKNEDEERREVKVQKKE